MNKPKKCNCQYEKGNGHSIECPLYITQDYVLHKDLTATKPQEPMEWDNETREILFNFWKQMKTLGDPFRDELIEETIYRLYTQIKQAEERVKKEIEEKL